jgi:NADPH-dependent 2,4-dienoyl-CoA reductase/sulfur reductase-like enzyme
MLHACISSWNGSERTLKRRGFLQRGALAAAGLMAGADRAAASAAGGPKVAIVGGGFAGSACALHLRQLNPAIQVSLIDSVERYATCPMSNEVIAGMRGMASITLGRGGLRRAGVNVIGDQVIAIDVQRRQLRLGAGGTLAFDRLVVAPGIRFLWDRIEGYDDNAAQKMPHAWKAGPQTMLLAAQLRGMPEGGVVAISVPSGLLRCPPAPYERASLIAHYLQRHKPRSKVLILDANNSFPKQAQFTEAWSTLYPGMIEWIPVIEDGTVVRVDTATMTLYTAANAHRVAVANIIPPQAPGELAPAAGLSSDHGWCPIQPDSFESTLVPGAHVIGDACIADAMPKSASAALSQAQQCATAVAAMLLGREAPAPVFDSICYSMLAPGQAIAFPAHFHVADGKIVAEQATSAPASPAQESLAAQRWYAGIRANAFAA